MPPGEAFPKTFNTQNHPYIKIAEELGFRLAECIDITDNVLPTMEMVNDALRSYVAPFVDISARYLQSISPWKSRALNFFGKKELQKITKIREYYLRRTQPEYFKEHMRYVIMRFDRDASYQRSFQPHYRN